MGVLDCRYAKLDDVLYAYQLPGKLEQLIISCPEEILVFCFEPNTAAAHTNPVFKAFPLMP